MCSQESHFKSTVGTVIALVNCKQGQSYSFYNFICTLCLFLQLCSNFLIKLHTNLKDI